MLTVQMNSKYANDIHKYAFDAFALCAYSHSIETKSRCGRRNYSPRQSGRPAAYLTLMGFVPAEMRGTKVRLALGCGEAQRQS